MKKGDRVEFVLNGETLYGVVDKGGEKKINVVIDGGKQQVAGHPSLFNPSTKPIPVDEPSVMDKWAVVGYKCHESMSDETDCMEADITLNGKKVIHASNRGNGGPNRYHCIPVSSDSEVVQQFLDDAKAWAIQFGEENPIEPYDVWVYWYAKQRPYGVLAKKAFCLD